MLVNQWKMYYVYMHIIHTTTKGTMHNLRKKKKMLYYDYFKDFF